MSLTQKENIDSNIPKETQAEARKR
jgi:hypothetical protein